MRHRRWVAAAMTAMLGVWLAGCGNDGNSMEDAPATGMSSGADMSAGSMATDGMSADGAMQDDMAADGTMQDGMATDDMASDGEMQDGMGSGGASARP